MPVMDCAAGKIMLGCLTQPCEQLNFVYRTAHVPRPKLPKGALRRLLVQLREAEPASISAVSSHM